MPLRGFLKEIKAFASLISFLTIIPTGKNDITEASKAFYMSPIVGALLGFLSGLCLLIPHVASSLRGGLTFILFYGLTGLIHLDGLADFIDAMSSGKTGNTALQIMKEPCRGAKSMAGVAIVLIIVYGSFTAFPVGLEGLYLLISANLIAYEGLYIIAVIANPPPYEGLGKLFIRASKAKQKMISNGVIFVLLALLISILSWSSLITFSILLSISITLSVIAYTAAKANNILGFISGDVMGYALEISRAISVITIALLSRLIL